MLRGSQRMPHIVLRNLLFFMECHFHVDGIKYHSRSKTQCVAILKGNEQSSLSGHLWWWWWVGGELSYVCGDLSYESRSFLHTAAQQLHGQ